MRKAFPIHGYLGILFLILSEFFLFRKIDPFYGWFYCFAWWSYILAVDAVIYRLKGNSLLMGRTREFFLMIPWSVFVWLIFEAANLSLRDWYYIDLPHSMIERWLGYAIAYGTVLPGLFETTELLATFGLFKNSSCGKVRVSNRMLVFFFLLGISCLSASVLFPEICFPLIWVGFVFLLDPLNYRFGGRSLLRDIEDGNPRWIYLLPVAGLICGLLWEFWNFWAPSKWVYTVPFFDRVKGFEMPLPGFFGFAPFAVEAYVMYNFVSLFRFGRGWEEPASGLHPDRKTSRLTSVLTAILLVSFFILMFQAVDRNTVDSYYPRLKDAYWIDSRYQAELPKVGIASLEDLVRKTMDRTERDELALRLLVPKEEFISWIEKARLALMKGLGIENFRFLERVDVSSVSALAPEDPEILRERIAQAFPGQAVPSLAKIRIWVRAAQKKVRSPEG